MQTIKSVILFENPAGTPEDKAALLASAAYFIASCLMTDYRGLG